MGVKSKTIHSLSQALGTGILAVNPLPLMVSTGVLGFVSSEPFTGFTLVINLYEIVNPCLQLVIFSLLTMDYEGYK